MMMFKKALTTKIVSLLIITYFLFTNVVYSSPVDTLDALRVPENTQGAKSRLRATQRRIFLERYNLVGFLPTEEAITYLATVDEVPSVYDAIPISKARIEQLITEGRACIAEKGDGTRVVALVSPIDLHQEHDIQAVAGIYTPDGITAIFTEAPEFDFAEIARIRDRYEMNQAGEPVERDEGDLYRQVMAIQEFQGLYGKETPTQELIEIVRNTDDWRGMAALVALELRGAMFSRGGKRKEAPERLKQAYLNASRAYHDAGFAVGREQAALPKNISRREWNKRADAIEKKHNMSAIDRQLKDVRARIARYDPPEGYSTWYSWMKAMLGYVYTGSPSPVFGILSDGIPRTKQEIADTLGLAVSTIEKDLYFLRDCGWLDIDKDGRKNTYAIKPKLREEGDLRRKIQRELDIEFSKEIKKKLENKEERIAARNRLLVKTGFSHSDAVPILFDGRARIFNRGEDLEQAVEEFCDNEVANLAGNEVAVVVVRTQEEEQRLRELLQEQEREDIVVILNIDKIEQGTDTHTYFMALLGDDDYAYAETQGGLRLDDLQALREHLDKA